jgi:cytochrome c2
MKQVSSWSAMARGLMAFAIVTFFAVGLAFGQAGQVMRFQIPNQFSLGSKVLPAGTYMFSAKGTWLVLASATGEKFDSSVIAQLSGPAELFRNGSLIFDKTDGGLILSEVWMPGTNGLLLHVIPKGHDRLVLWGSSLSPTLAVSGKEAFNLTCANCHGGNGEGDEGANKYFGTAIPKLNSAEVQAKSDAELRALINQGDQKMPPVEIDEAGYRHRLPPQDVDAVIAYLRTLKR